MHLRKFVRGAVAASVLVAGLATLPAQAAHSQYNHTVTSKADGTSIVITVFRPDAADDVQVPMVLHSHGWAGGRSTTGFASYLDNGFGVASIDQRGHGASGGQANVEDPDLEGRDIESVVDYLAGLDWVVAETPRDVPVGRD